MATTVIQPVNLFASAASYDVSNSADFSTLTTGSGNGIEVAWKDALFAILKNDTGGAAVFTIKVPTPSSYDGIVAIPDDTVSVPNGELHIYRLAAVLKQLTGTSAGNIIIECDVAGKVLIAKSFTNA